MATRSLKGIGGIGLILTAIAIMLGPKPLQGQTSFGTILGTVSDSSNAGIPDGSITITNAQTGIARVMKSDQYGNYTAGSLLPGVYNVKVEHSGFQTTEASNIELPVAQTVTVNLKMQVGSITQTVQVTAAAPLLNTSNATVGTIVNNKDVVNLPLNGRSYTELLLLVPGSVPVGTVFAISSGHNFSVSGSDQSENNYSLDGIENNELFFKQFAIQPSIDAIQEFKVQTNITSAEYGQAAGSNVNVAIKSGTNQLHGSLFEFVRNDKFDASDFFRNYFSTPSSPAVKPAFRQNQFGAVIGGPVIIPHVYNGHDKLFWLFNYEGLRARRASTGVATVPTGTELSGDLRDQGPIFDPATTRTDPISGLLVRDRISCNGVLNVICPDRIDPAMAAFATQVYPATNVAGAGNVVNHSPFSQNTWQMNIRSDYKITDKLTFFARYSHFGATEAAPQGLPKFETDTTNKYRNAVASWTYLASPTTVIDIKLGVNRTNILNASNDPAPGAASYLAAHPLQGIPIKNKQFPELPGVGIPGFSTPSEGGVPIPTTDLMGIFSVQKIMGRHSLKFGYQHNNVRSLEDNFFSGSYAFDGVPTSDPQNRSTTGSALGSFLLGLPSSGNRNIGNTLVHMRWQQWQGYVQDDYKVTQRLTLNLGLRYEYNAQPVDLNDRQGMFDRTSGQYVWAGINPVTGQGPNVRRSVRDPDFNNFAPRFGFAYQLQTKTTIRGGYGIFYATDYLWHVQGIRGQWPYAVSDNLSGKNDPVVNAPVETFFDPNLDVTPTSKPAGIFALGRTDRSGYTQHWNLGVQRQLAQDLLLEVDYVGTKGTKMATFLNTNTAQPGPGAIGSPEHPRPFPAADTLSEGLDLATSIYHSAQVKLEKRFNNGLQFLGSYTWSHYIDVAAGGPGGTNVQSEYNIRADRASGLYDFRHIFTGSYFYQLPFGRGKRFLSNAGGIVNGFAGGWEITGVTRYNSGPPINVGLTIDNANVGGGAQRPNRILGQPARVSVPGDPTQGWLNPAAFQLPAPFTFGNLGRDTERGPGFGNWDLGFFKNFPLHGEHTSLQFRSEFFNLFNHTNLGGPSASFCEPIATCNSNFGRIFSTANNSREIQFALKLLF